MNTPIWDFVRRYAAGDVSRLHVPGHKGRGPLGIEALDLTEIAGADALYEAEGIIAESEANAAALFGSGRTLYSTEGSSQCIRAMLYLALTARRSSAARPLALAARNAHKSFLYAAALCDFDVEWLYPEADAGGVCACPISPEAVARRMDALPELPFCLYVTSPDYLGGQQNLPALAEVCRGRGVPLLVDNAHGAYMKFLPRSAHPLDLGAAMCADSAHKTLPVLTGGAYLHISKKATPLYASGAKAALSLFGSTSPSYLTLASLDLANAALARDFPQRLRQTVERLDSLKRTLTDRDFLLLPSEPMKLTLAGDGLFAAQALRAQGVECEFADRDHLVLMFSPDNREEDFIRVEKALDRPLPPGQGPFLPPKPSRRPLTIRQAMFAPSEVIPVREAVGRITAAPTVSCPPAIPIAVSGEEITEAHVQAFLRYGIEMMLVVKQTSV